MTERLSPKMTFTTDIASAEDTSDIWKRFMFEVYCKLDTVIPGDYVKGKIVSRGFADLGVSYWGSSSHRVIRRKQFAQEDGVERILFIFPFNGGQVYRRNGHVQNVGPGSQPFYVVNHAEPYEVDFIDSWCEAYGVSIPTDLMRMRVHNLDNLCRDTRLADPVLTSTVGHVCHGLIDVGSNLRADRLQSLCLSLIELMIDPKHAASPTWRYSEGAADFVAEEALSFIQQNLTDRDFDAAAAARLCRVSVRHLQKVFQDRGTTFGRELMEARLIEAWKMLKTVHTPPQQIREIAAACGFVNQAHFATRYRQRFGVSPRFDRE